MRFFFYGTLGVGMDNPVINAIRPLLGPPRPASTLGALYALPDRDGWYPGLVVAGEGLAAGPVQGVLYDPDAGPGAGFTVADLARLDAYEAFDPADPGASEYVRREIAVTVDGAALAAQAYLYNRPLPPAAQPIAGGSFPAFLAAHGLRALAPRDP